MWDRKGVDSEGTGGRKQLRGAVGGEIVVRIYYVIKESISNTQKNTKKLSFIVSFSVTKSVI